MSTQTLSHLVRRLLKTIEKHKLISQGEYILVAVSGGPDSVALLHGLYALREKLSLRLGVVHFEHGIRGKTSLRDAAFVKKLATSLDLPFFMEHGKAKEYAEEKRLSLEMAARQLRYAFFERVLKQTQADKLALGHTADDQVEEILRRLLRGTAWIGLGGMEIKRGPYIRPLLEIFKEEILKTLHQEGISYMVDETNLEKSFLRNRIRHELLPILLKFNPRFKEILLEMAAIWQEENAWIEKEVDKTEAECVVFLEKGICLDLESFSKKDLVIKRRLLARLLHKTAFKATRRHLDMLLKVAYPGGPLKVISLPAGWKGYKKGKWLYIHFSTA